jgi:hypothetical protein
MWVSYIWLQNIDYVIDVFFVMLHSYFPAAANDVPSLAR